MDIYQELNVKKMINAAGTYTDVGATKMSLETLDAICQASRSYVKIRDLHEAINKKIAELTRNESAYVCNSCSTAIYLAIAAFISQKNGRQFKYIEKNIVEKSEVIGLWNQHIPYDRVVEQLGVRFKFIGYTTPGGGVTKEDLRMSINENTVGIYFAARTPKGYYSQRFLNLEDVIEVARECGVPVIVDAAAQLPPKNNLWEFTKMGADVVTFSGGKDLAGPQASGLAVGKRIYIDWMCKIGFPNYDVGRMMKCGREEMVALYAAIKQYMNCDEDKRLRWCETQVTQLQKLLSESELFYPVRCWPNQAGQPLPRSFVRVKDNPYITPDELADKLMEFDPGIYCITEGKEGIFINPMCLEDGEINYIAEKLIEIEKNLK